MSVENKIQLLQQFCEWTTEVGPEGQFTKEWVDRGRKICAKVLTIAETPVLRKAAEKHLVSLNQMNVGDE